jgi:hypothetical protein
VPPADDVSVLIGAKYDELSYEFNVQHAPGDSEWCRIGFYVRVKQADGLPFFQWMVSVCVDGVNASSNASGAPFAGWFYKLPADLDKMRSHMQPVLEAARASDPRRAVALFRVARNDADDDHEPLSVAQLMAEAALTLQSCRYPIRCYVGYRRAMAAIFDSEAAALEAARIELKSQVAAGASQMIWRVRADSQSDISIEIEAPTEEIGREALAAAHAHIKEAKLPADVESRIDVSLSIKPLGAYIDAYK